MEGSGHLSARKEVGVGLDPGNDFTHDDSIGEDVSLKTEEHSMKPHRSSFLRVVHAVRTKPTLHATTTAPFCLTRN